MQTERLIKRAETKAKAIDLLGGVCVSCGSQDRLEFDHMKNDRESVSRCISQMLSNSWKSILLELKKCQLLCKKCHVSKSLVTRGFSITPKHGTLSTYVNYKCRCDKCKSYNTLYYKNKRLGVL